MFMLGLRQKLCFTILFLYKAFYTKYFISINFDNHYILFFLFILFPTVMINVKNELIVKES